jgi:hypothetical protein
MFGVSASFFSPCSLEVSSPHSSCGRWTQNSADTPWDEPSENSVEFCAFLNGEIFEKDPWNRLSSTVLGMARRSSRRFCRIDWGQA